MNLANESLLFLHGLSHVKVPGCIFGTLKSARILHEQTCVFLKLDVEEYTE